MKKKLVPNTFEVPEKLETERMRLRMLSVDDVVKDFDAVMTSEEYLLERKPFGPSQRWPTGLSLVQNLVDLGWHQKEFQMRTEFAYTVMSLDESTCLGCMYIEASPNPAYEVEVTSWVRQSEAETGLDEHLYQTIRKWLSEVWPFDKVAYPGREISWEDYQK